jgi:hypothetical protein
MAINNEIEAGAKAIAEDLRLPGGGLKKLARVVEDHLDWFDTVEARGLTWPDMSRLLFAAGAKGRNGRPFSVGTLYSTVWRKREDVKRVGKGVASSKSTTGIQGATRKRHREKADWTPLQYEAGTSNRRASRDKFDDLHSWSRNVARRKWKRNV